MKIHAVTFDVTVNEQQLDQWAAVAQVVDHLHLRFPKKNGAEVYDIANELLKRGVTNKKLIMHDRLDIALLLDLTGVQLGYRSPRVAVIRQRFPHLTIGASVHSVPEAVEASRQGADYVLFGHIFETSSKPGRPPQGLTTLSEVVDNVSVPVIAIGGITTERLPDVAKTGTRGVAVQGGIFQTELPLESAKTYVRKARA